MNLKQELKDHIWLMLQGPLGPYIEHKQDVSPMSTKSSKETALYPTPLSFNTLEYIHTHWKIVGRELLKSMLKREAEFLLPRPEHTICLKAKHRPVSRAPGAGSVYLHQRMAVICRLCGEEELSAAAGLGSPPPAFTPWWQTCETTQQPKGFGAFFCLFFHVKYKKKLFLYPSNRLWTVSKTWEVS